MKKTSLVLMISVLAASLMACSLLGDLDLGSLLGQEAQPTSRPIILASPDGLGADEPVLITGTIPYTWPFFEDMNTGPFVLLEDQAGFVHRDEDFIFPLESQVIGPVWTREEGVLEYTLTLPSVPQGTLVDVDNNGRADTGLMVFAVAYWSNTWGGPFLEERDGTGWSGAYSSTVVNFDRDNEIESGLLVIYALDDQQSFPTGFGADGLLFTEDDPVAPVPAGYSFVDLNQQPFNIFKQAHLELELVEGDLGLRDYSDMGFGEAFETFFARASLEYPFTQEKNVDWQALHTEFAPQFGRVSNSRQFFDVMQAFMMRIPDGHIGMTPNGDAFWEREGGGFGWVLTQLSDGRVVVSQVLDTVEDASTGQRVSSPAAETGVQVGAEIISWNGQPAAQALAATPLFFGPASTPDGELLDRLTMFARIELFQALDLEYRNPGGQSVSVTLASVPELDSYFASYGIPDALQQPVEGEIFEELGIAYIRINDFLGDPDLMARTWEHFIAGMNEEGVESLVLDMRYNSGGSMGLAFGFAEFFYDEEVTLWSGEYYNGLLEEFKISERPVQLKPTTDYFDGDIIILISPTCVSACEGFTYSLSSTGRARVVGYSTSAGAFGGVGLGQYRFPGDYDFQIPTTKSIDSNGNTILEGIGIVPDILVPFTMDSLMSSEDELLQIAIAELQR